MTNKLRRSMTSVLLAASLLFSSQSVVAFADYGSKSDASDLSPVQESVENATEEQQEDPSLSVEPVIGESTEAPVAAPMMARANAPVAYSAPEVSGYEEYLYYDYSDENPHPDTIAVYTTAGTKGKGNIESYAYMGDFSRFTTDSSWQSYTVSTESFEENGWIFKDWDFKFTKGDDPTNLGNPYDYGFGKRYTFSDGSESWKNEYNGGNCISVNALIRADTYVVFHHSIYANFNPLVTVTTDGNGTVSPAPNEELVEHDGKYEVAYGEDATFIITPNDGYKVASVTADGIVIPVDENGKCTLPPVTEPTTLEVTFEEDSTIPSIPEPDNSNIENFIVTVKCDKDHSSPFNPLYVSDAYEVADKDPDPRISWISVNHEVLCDEFSKVYGNHTLLDNDSKWTPIELKWDDQGKEWKLSDSNQKNITLNVKCTSEIPEPDESIISQLGVALNCVNVTDGSHNDTSKLSTFTTGYYTCTVDQEKQTATVKIDDTQAKYWIDNNINTMVGKEQHSFVSVSDPITLTYENGQWKVPEDDNAKKIVIKMLCGPTIEQINEQLNAQIVCVNNDAKHQKTASFDNLLDSSFDVTNLKNDESFITCEVVVKPSLYLDKFYNISGGIKHSVVIGNETYPVNPDGSVTVRFNYTKDTGWKLLYPTKNMVTFPVECTTEKPVTPPTENQVKALFKGLVNVKCSTNTNHSSLNYDITEFDIGDAWAVVPQNNSETPSVSFVDVTINQTATYFFNQYNSDTGHASTSYSGSVPASIRLMFNNETEQWEIYSPTGTINLTVTCSTGGTITPTPGGNGGDNDDDDDRYTGGNTVTRTINDDDVPLNDRPTNTTTIDDEDVPLADLPDDTVTIDDGEVPLKANPSTGDSLPFAAMAAAALSLGGVIVLNRKKK